MIVTTDQFGPIHVRPQAWKEISAIAKRRNGEAVERKSKPPEEPGIGSKALDVAKEAPGYIIGSGKGGSLAGDSVRIARKAADAMVGASMRTGMRLGAKIKKQALEFDPNDQTRGPSFGP